MTGHPETQHYRMTAESPELIESSTRDMTKEIQSILQDAAVGLGEEPQQPQTVQNNNNHHHHHPSRSIQSAATTTSANTHTTTDHHYQGYRIAYQQNPEYVESLKLQFLRAEEFHPKNAAQRLLSYFDMKQQLFGPQGLGRDIRYDDLSPDDKESLEAGGMQTLPVTDHAGRAIIFTRQANYKYKEHNNMVSFFVFVFYFCEGVRVFDCFSSIHTHHTRPLKPFPPPFFLHQSIVTFNVLLGNTDPQYEGGLSKVRLHIRVVPSRTYLQDRRVRLRIDT
jgi:hypothetical protein